MYVMDTPNLHIIYYLHSVIVHVHTNDNTVVPVVDGSNMFLYWFRAHENNKK